MINFLFSLWVINFFVAVCRRLGFSGSGLCGRILCGGGLLESTCPGQQWGSEGNRKEYGEKSNHHAVTTKSCPELGPGGWAFNTLCLDQSWMQDVLRKGMWPDSAGGFSYLYSQQRCTGKPALWKKEKRNKTKNNHKTLIFFVCLFAGFYSISRSIMADFKLLWWCHWMRVGKRCSRLALTEQ